ncbi:hypothetical protein MERGE_000692 [Pneumocystis wakefieldiae]|uniref:Translation initiation factor RLI1 n=1 Tax=Pneumocystis wakefieldiae TaxID=38082 RepID=A0A899G186_9ASCO|nr:hypothetical protein MERGE_000692 [Pneumocystis wakefieldiae]
MSKKTQIASTEKLTRVAIVNGDKCKPRKCHQECKKSCPVVRGGKLCIEVTPESKISWISESLCIGCGICVKRCPFGAIHIINLPTNLESKVTHRFSGNSFKLHRLPTPRPGQILGLVGANGIGKSTALKILAGKLKPNLGQHSNPPDWEEILSREVDQLSGGELQRFAIAIICIQKADIYMFDEPSSYLDVKQRLNAAKIIRLSLKPDNYIIVVEHDLSILDYLSDYICILYGMPSVYGVVTLPFSVREGLNIFLDGNIPTENLRFRNESLLFKISDSSDIFSLERNKAYEYPSMTKKLGDFTLEISAGKFTNSEIIVMLGENGTGKTTFIKLLAGILKPDGKEEVLGLSVSLKPQKITPKFQGTVLMLFLKKIKTSWLNSSFQSDVCKPLNIENIVDNEVQDLSGGELQRVAIVLCLGLSADVYLIDEPSAYLDSEQPFVVEHDFIMATYLADRVIVFEGQPSIKMLHCVGILTLFVQGLINRIVKCIKNKNPQKIFLLYKTGIYYKIKGL